MTLPLPSSLHSALQARAEVCVSSHADQVTAKEYLAIWVKNWLNVSDGTEGARTELRFSSRDEQGPFLTRPKNYSGPTKHKLGSD